MFRNFVVLIAAATVAAASAAPLPPQPAPIRLANVNGEPVTDADLKEAFVNRHGGHTVFLGGDAEARRFLQIVIDQRLLVQEAYNLGLDTDAGVKPQVDAFRDQRAAEYLLRKEIDEKAEPSEEEVRAAWDRSDKLFLARELVLDTKAEAEEIRIALLSGVDFETVARGCSTSQSRSRGGSLAPFTWGSLSPELESVAFLLEPGELSQPFKTADGWCLLYLVDRVDAFRPELDTKVRARISAKLRERRKRQLTEELSSRLWKKYNAVFDLASFSPVDFSRLAEQNPEAVVARWDGGSLKAKDAFTAGELKMYSSFAPGRAADKVETTLRSAVNTSLIQIEARTAEVAGASEVAQAVRKFEAGLIEDLLYTRHVLKDVFVSEEEIRAAYQEKKATLLMPEKRRVSHIAVKSEDEARALIAKLAAGADFLELLKSNTLDQSTVKTEGDLGWIEKGKVAEIYDELFTLPVGGTVTKPIRSESAWHVVRVAEILPQHPLAFVEARDQLKTNLFEKKKTAARAAWVAKLRDAAEIEVLDAGVRAFVKANPYEEPQR